MNSRIKNIYAREILDSRGNPTLRATVLLESGHLGAADVPSGASTGKYEACELRDGDKSRYLGRGVLKAADNANRVICPALAGEDATDQRKIDERIIALDGSESKSRLGANATLAVSLATARAAANYAGLELYEYLSVSGGGRMPTPMFNLLNGGAHAANNIDIQEFMVLPHGLSLPEAIRAGSEIYHTLGRLLRERGLSSGVGDEGGYAPNLDSDEEPVDLLCRAIRESGHSTDNVGIALDVAASEWYEGGEYRLPKRAKRRSRHQLTDYYRDLCDRYPIISIEDGLSEDDFDGWEDMTASLGKRCMLVGDDLFVTNSKRLAEGIRMNMGNAILIKPNQIGTLTETLRVIETAREAGYKFIISHRSGDTPDTFIADLAVATGAQFIKSGAPARGERVAKYNRLLEIYDKISPVK